MQNDKNHIIIEYLRKVKSANKEFTKKELFKDLLRSLYAGKPEIEKIIDAMSLGAESAIFNIPRRDRMSRGSADTLYNNIIIEFENSLKVSYKHAKEQLAGYYLGKFNSNEGSAFALIASDFINWKVLAPDISCLNSLGTLQEHELILNEVPNSSFTLDENNAEDFYYWIDRFLFKEEKVKATLKSVEDAFGSKGGVFIESFRQIMQVFQTAKKFGEVQVSYEQWSKFLSIAYGSFDDTDEAFVIHTYLSVLAKTLAYEVLSDEAYIDDNAMKGILSGTIFTNYNIKNFVDNDFFHWVYIDRYFNSLKKTFRLISQELSTFNFTNVDEDILKGVYQELIDLDTRRSLGEYYTPDWLCERIVNEFEFKPSDKILDPSCGSGSFLRAIIHRMKVSNPEMNSAELNNAVFGIDIHPLSVQIAKTTVLLALNKDLINYKQPISINVILANTLLAPEGVQDLFGSEFNMMIDEKKLSLSTQILDDSDLFNSAVDHCEELAEITLHKSAASIETLTSAMKQTLQRNGFNQNILNSFYKIYLGLKEVKEKGRDSIWAFILKNLYKPYFYSENFNYVIGNPPWFTFSSIKNEEYQKVLNALADKYNVKPDRIANFPHLEIAAIFLAYSSSYFLKPNGKIVFVLPRSFYNADHHDNTRSGKALGFKLNQIWDLENVSPLFNVPSCVLFADKNIDNKRALSPKGINSIAFSGIVPKHNCSLIDAQKKLKEENGKIFYAKQGASTAFSAKLVKPQSKINPYKKLFKQGATIVPRTFYFVEFRSEIPPSFADRNIVVRTSKAVKPDAKAPWKDIEFSDLIEGKFLFLTALSRSILPFALYKPSFVVLPITIEIDEEANKKIVLNESDKLLTDGCLKATKWFRNAENIWSIHRTEKNRKHNVYNYLNWQNKLTSQNLNARYLVIYNSSAKDANATIVDRLDYELDFIVESVAYVYYTNSIDEARYLTAILNSTAPNEMMKDFQAKGLFGPRHVHKKILDIYFPKFNSKNEKHIDLARLTQKAEEKAKTYLSENSPKEELSAFHLGRIRTEIKKQIEPEMAEIDVLVKEILK